MLIVASKIVALAEGRTAHEKERVRLIHVESDAAIRTRYVWLTRQGGMLSANAGIDDSNGNGKVVLLPKNSVRAAAKIRLALMRTFRVQQLGVIVADSCPLPMRVGVIGMALGYAGFRGVRDYRGKRDLFGRKFVFSQTNVADALATAAVLVMGEGAERRPLASIVNAPVEFTNRVARGELVVDPKTDMYAPLLTKLFQKKKRRG